MKLESVGLCAVAAMVFASGAETGVPINQRCPVMEDEAVDPRFTVDYEGKTIGFCCEKCVAKFLANPDRYVGRIAGLGQVSTSALQSSEGNEGGGDKGQAGSSAVYRLYERGGRFHPALVHAPIAAVPLALIGLLVWRVSRNPAFAAADVPPLLVGGLSSILAVITGNMANWTIPLAESLHWYLEWHEFAGTSLMILTLGLCGLRLWSWRGWTGLGLRVYTGGLIVASVLAVASGYLGGTLVFGPEHLWK